jgi:hypothetical protein
VNLIIRDTALLEKLNRAAGSCVNRMYMTMSTRVRYWNIIKILMNPVPSYSILKMYLTIDLTSVSRSYRLSLCVHRFVKHFS